MPAFGSRDLYVGDILRLPENYDLGPESGPVDLLVFHPRDDEAGLGLMVVSGYKAGLVYAVLPRASGPAGAISIAWLKENWDKWFCYPYDDAMRTIPMETAVILEWTNREIREIA